MKAHILLNIKSMPIKDLKKGESLVNIQGKKGREREQDEERINLGTQVLQSVTESQAPTANRNL